VFAHSGTRHRKLTRQTVGQKPQHVACAVPLACVNPKNPSFGHAPSSLSPRPLSVASESSAPRAAMDGHATVEALRSRRYGRVDAGATKPRRRGQGSARWDPPSPPTLSLLSPSVRSPAPPPSPIPHRPTGFADAPPLPSLYASHRRRFVSYFVGLLTQPTMDKQSWGSENFRWSQTADTFVALLQAGWVLLKCLWLGMYFYFFAVTLNAY